MSEGANPFEPPKAAWEKGERPAFAGDFIDASQGVRFANFLLDTVFRFMLIVVVAVVFGDNLGVALLFSLLYYIVFEALFARTPAKWITKTRVIDFNGGTPRFTQILGRSFARFVPFEPFSFFVNVQGWHDRWSNTRVVKDGVRLSDL